MGTDVSYVPTGLSQRSHLAEDVEEDDDTFGFVMEVDDTEVQCRKNNSSDILQSAFYQMAESINNSGSKEAYEKEVLDFFLNMSAKASGDCESNKRQHGKRISMLPPNSQRKKTHGTAHMKANHKFK